MNHDEVALTATKYIKGLHGCSIGAVNFACGWATKERVDGLAFSSTSSYLIEAKVSRADFKGDSKKEFRIKPETGMGRFRYYACPKGLIGVEELPEKWGLIEISENKRAFMVHGYGRSKKIGEEKHPVHGWTVPVLKLHGSTRLREGFEFTERNLEAEFNALFFLAKRYRDRKFMDNIL